MVDAHEHDLHAAAAVGMRTAYVHRPLKHGPEHSKPWPQANFDLMATDFIHLAVLLEG